MIAFIDRPKYCLSLVSLFPLMRYEMHMRKCIGSVDVSSFMNPRAYSYTGFNLQIQIEKASNLSTEWIQKNVGNRGCQVKSIEGKCIPVLPAGNV